MNERARQIASRIAAELRAEVDFARQRPVRRIDEIDAHMDALMLKVASLAELIAEDGP